MKKKCLRQSASRPYVMDLSALTDDDWDRLSKEDCQFCGCHIRHSRNLQNIAIKDWNRTIDSTNVITSCQLCWSTRDGASPEAFRLKCREIANFNANASIKKNKYQIAKAPPREEIQKLNSQIRKRELSKCRALNGDALLVATTVLSYPCWYCGCKSTGADRLDSFKCPGYVLANVVPCCEKCNRMKHVLPRGLFLRHMAYVTNNSPTKKLTSEGKSWARAASNFMRQREIDFDKNALLH